MFDLMKNLLKQNAGCQKMLLNRQLNNAAKGISYESTKGGWEEPGKEVHGKMTPEAIAAYGDYIGEMMKLDNSDRLMSVGCGDAQIDRCLLERFQLKSICGFDFSEPMIERAKENNPKGTYWVQSFLDSNLYHAVPGGM